MNTLGEPVRGAGPPRRSAAAPLGGAPHDDEDDNDSSECKAVGPLVLAVVAVVFCQRQHDKGDRLRSSLPAREIDQIISLEALPT
jgi:hypothetical protein